MEGKHEVSNVLINTREGGFDISWGYEGEVGPAHWGGLCPSYAACAEGKEQSPIDIASATAANSADLRFAYRPSALTFVDNGPSIMATYDTGSTLTVDGQRYELIQFHFHSPASIRWMVSRRRWNCTWCIRTRTASWRWWACSWWKARGTRRWLRYLTNLPAAAPDPVRIDGATVDAAAFLPADASYWRYDGSLTTPPCSEGVKWFVLTQPAAVSAEQIAAYTTLHGGNARPVQPMNARKFIAG